MMFTQEVSWDTYCRLLTSADRLSTEYGTLLLELDTFGDALSVVSITRRLGSGGVLIELSYEELGC